MLAKGRRVAATALALVLASSAAQAIAPRSLRRVDEDGLIGMTPATARTPLRRIVRVAYDRPMRAAAWSRFAAAAGGRWHASWDRATAVPGQIWGEGIAVPGSSADADIAAGAARDLIAAHLDLLAPGTDPADLVLVSNTTDGELRSIGFVQMHGGMRVLGGQVSVRIKQDRIFVIASQALPDVTVPVLHAKLASIALAGSARAALDHELGLPATATVGAPGEPAILPLVSDDRVLGYRVVAPIEIDAGADGAWTAFVDPGSGEVVARRQELDYVSAGSVQYDVVERWTGRPRINLPAAGVDLTVDGIAARATSTGGIIWLSNGPADVVTGVTGETAIITDESTTPLVTGDITVPQQGVGVFSVATDELTDAQVNTYIHAGVVREFAKENFARGLPFLYEPVDAHVNIDDQCNAFSNGTSINFFKSSVMCENTGRMADVVYHEYGHSIHHHAIIDGVGAFDTAMSEGASDFLAASITGDHGMGRGFFHGDDPLRDIDPDDTENIWPRDTGEVHFEGLIFAGTFWDLRKQLISDLGAPAGIALTLKLYYAALQRATDIPSGLIEVLAADDNDGNLDNGTPHECSIRSVFGVHGLRTVSGAVEAPGAVVATAGQTAAPVQIHITGLSSNCPGDDVAEVDLSWHPGVGGSPAAGMVAATAAGPDWSAELPLPGDGGRVDYRVDLRFSDGNVEHLPDNAADTYYEMYQGETVPLYCTSFDTDPFSEGWMLGTTSDYPHENFEWGPPSTAHSATDPDVAFTGDNILALGLGFEYGDDKSVSVNLPPIDIHQYSDVQLQYRRWLSVEDGFFDHALIQANGETVWANYDSMMGDSSSTAHIDREWRFSSVPLSAHFDGPILNLSFRLDSDQGLHFGGWAIDDLCVVANPLAICGDGVKSGAEECDDGPANSNAADTCRTNCRLAKCGDGIVDTGEECEPGVDDGCLPACIYDMPPDGGCCSASGGDPAGLLLAGGVGLLLIRRRRKSRT